ncbi:MAG: serine/threonine protein kinase [Planctomycetes bacterium]|nr:serine/threonine protein kinase [Planctomycetota bacterium]
MDKNESLEAMTFPSSSTYTIIEELGRGGMGVVYLAEKNCEGVLDYVVLKSILTVNETNVKRLRQEANVATMLRHENIVKTYGLESIPLSMLPRSLAQSMDEKHSGATVQRTKDFKRRKLEAPGGKHSARRSDSGLGAINDSGKKMYMMAMDFIDGADLDNILRAHFDRGLLMPPQLAAFAISRICRALAYAHEWIVHRDISPENILINNQGVAKLTDFGIAVAADDADQGFAGKLHFMAPEQLGREQVDGRADMFALGLVAYQAVTGIPVYVLKGGLDFKGMVEYVKQQMSNDIVPPHMVREDVPKELSKIIMRMLAMDKKQRFSDMHECSAEIEGGYLYAKGFGPTNNSLMAYIDIFEHQFQKYTNDQLRNLTFLKNAEGKIQLKRKLKWDDYSKLGKKMILGQKGTNSNIYRAIAKLNAAAG